MALTLFVVTWILALILTFVPAIPATLILFGGAAGAVLIDGYSSAELPFLIVMGVLSVAAMLVDNVAASWGAGRYGGTSAGMWGALIGGLAGLWLPLGLLWGPALGAFLFEFGTGRSAEDALKSAWGTLIGLLSGMAARFGLHVLMGMYGLWELRRLGLW